MYRTLTPYTFCCLFFKYSRLVANLKEITTKKFLAVDTITRTCTAIVHTIERPSGLSDQGLQSFAVLKSKEWDCAVLKYSQVL